MLNVVNTTFVIGFLYIFHEFLHNPMKYVLKKSVIHVLRKQTFTRSLSKGILPSYIFQGKQTTTMWFVT